MLIGPVRHGRIIDEEFDFDGENPILHNLCMIFVFQARGACLSPYNFFNRQIAEVFRQIEIRGALPCTHAPQECLVGVLLYIYLM